MVVERIGRSRHVSARYIAAVRVHRSHRASPEILSDYCEGQKQDSAAQVGDGTGRVGRMVPGLANLVVAVGMVACHPYRGSLVAGASLLEDPLHSGNQASQNQKIEEDWDYEEDDRTDAKLDVPAEAIYLAQRPIAHWAHFGRNRLIAFLQSGLAVQDSVCCP